MRLYIILFAFIVISSSCKEPFGPKTDTANSPLVVDGLITDEAKPYTIRLYMADQFQSEQGRKNETNADVTVSDDLGHTYKFTETSAGVYVSNPSVFVGQPGRTYTLSVNTSDNNVFHSNPQLLLPNNFNVNTYAELASQDQMVDDGNGNAHKELVEGVNLLVDVQNSTDTVPHFRFDHSTYTECSYTIIISQLKRYVYYAWNLKSDNDLVNISDGQYQTSMNDIKKHKICFLPSSESIEVVNPDSVEIDPPSFTAYISLNIIKVTQYRINNETYKFNKDVNTLLAAQNKTFDPTAFQIKGNMYCDSNPQKLVLGFFEASSARTNYYKIKPGKLVVTSIDKFEPPSSSGVIGTIESLMPPIFQNPPDFWVH